MTVPKIDPIDLVTQMIEYIESNLTQPLSVELVCKRGEMSSWQSQRVFRAVVGDSIGNYIRGRRLTLASQMIRSNPEHRLLDIAIEFQFGSHEAFTRAFKAHFGITPADFRRTAKTIRTRMKPKLNRDRIVRISSGISKNPSLVRLPRRSFIGMVTQINSPLGVDSDFDKTIPLHWLEFNRRRCQISGRKRGIGYGICLFPSDDMDGETLSYLAAAEVGRISEIPEGMISLEMEEQEYAAFETQGDPETCHTTSDYIYGIWLPQSEYQRARGHDYEVFDRHYRLKDPSSRSLYFIPVQRK